MKHSIKITALLIIMFFTTQLIGLAVIEKYGKNEDRLPYGMEPPKGIEPKTSLLSIVSAIFFAVLIMFLLMRYRAEFFIKLWFFAVTTIAIGITINAVIFGASFSSIIAFAIALPLAFIKMFRRSMLVHNFTELLIYPGIAAVFVPILNLWTIILLLVFISFYDIYAVWHSGFMQKMAKYQIKQLKVFSGFFIPYLGRKEQAMIAKSSPKSFSKKMKKIKVNVAILGGGDVVFPIIFAGVVMRTAGAGIIGALASAAGATLALALLFYFSEKGKFYPAMPFISTGCFLSLALFYIISSIL